MIWNEKQFDVSTQEKILAILEKFEIIYCSYSTEGSESEKKKSLETLKYVIVPSLLPSSPSKTEYLNGLLPSPLEASVIHKREFKFQFIALGFFSRLIVRFFNSSKLTVEECWQHGIVLADEFGDLALVLCDYDHSKSHYSVKVFSQFSPDNKKRKRELEEVSKQISQIEQQNSDEQVEEEEFEVEQEVEGVEEDEEDEEDVEDVEEDELYNYDFSKSEYQMEQSSVYGESQNHQMESPLPTGVVQQMFQMINQSVIHGGKHEQVTSTGNASVEKNQRQLSNNKEIGMKESLKL